MRSCQTHISVVNSLIARPTNLHALHVFIYLINLLKSFNGDFRHCSLVKTNIECFSNRELVMLRGECIVFVCCVKWAAFV